MVKIGSNRFKLPKLQKIQNSDFIIKMILICGDFYIPER